MNKLLIFLILFITPIITSAQSPLVGGIEGSGVSKIIDVGEVAGEFVFNYRLHEIFYKTDSAMMHIPTIFIKYVYFVPKRTDIQPMRLVPLKIEDDYKGIRYHDVLVTGELILTQVLIEYKNIDYPEEKKHYRKKYNYYLFYYDDYIKLDTDWSFKKDLLPLMEDRKDEMVKYMREKKLKLNRTYATAKISDLYQIILQYNVLKDENYMEDSHIFKTIIK